MQTPQVFRYYQEEADAAIYNELSIADKCLVKKFIRRK